MALKHWYTTTNVRAGRLAGAKTRVTIFGDSLAQAIFGTPANHDSLFGDLIINNLGYDSVFVGFVATGLLDFNSDTSGTFAGPLHRWCKIVDSHVKTYDPDVLIICYRGNYRIFDPGQPNINPNTTQFYTAWQNEAIHFNTLAQQNGAQTFWLIGPSMLDPTEDAMTRGVSSGYIQMVESMENTGTVNAYRWLPDPWALYNCEGIKVRNIDGIHFSAGGANLMASVCLDRVVPSWKILVP